MCVLTHIDHLTRLYIKINATLPFFLCTFHCSKHKKKSRTSHLETYNTSSFINCMTWSLVEIKNSSHWLFFDAFVYKVNISWYFLFCYDSYFWKCISMIIGYNIWMICLELNWIFTIRVEFVWTLRSVVWVLFNNFLLIDTTNRSKISIDQKCFFFAVSLYPL